MAPQTKAMNTMPFWHTLVVKAAQTFPKSCFFFSSAAFHRGKAKQDFLKLYLLITMKSEQIKCMAGCLSQGLQKVRHAENQCQCKLSSILFSHRNPWCLNPFPRECLAVSEEGAREM